MEPDPTAAATVGNDGSVFLRIFETAEAGADPVAIGLIEVDREGYIPREVGLRKDGTLEYVTRPGEYGQWNDSPNTRTLPGTPAFEEFWGLIGSETITKAEFERTYAEADATLPHTIGGTPLWVDSLVSWTVILVLLAIVLGVIYAASNLLGA